MKKTLPTSGKARSANGYHKHLDKKEGRRANRGTRRILKEEDRVTTCCANENRSLAGGCLSCGDPSL